LTILKALFLSLLIVATTACDTRKQYEHKQTFFVFGTSVNIQIQGISEKKALLAIQTIEQDFHQLNKEWHAWDKGGIVSQINKAIANNENIIVNDEVKRFIQTSQQLAKQSNYLFDPAIGKLIALWSFHSEDWQGPPPTKKQLEKWRKDRPSIKNISFVGNSLSSTNNQVQLDFGANAKGLALKKAIKHLKNVGIKNAIVNIGGDMSAIGQNITENGTKKPWQIGIQSPTNPNKIIAIAKLPSNLSIVTSGTYQRYFEWQGKRYSHLINPNTAKPADSLASVTVIHADPTLADAAATAILIAGKNNSEKIAKQMGITELLIINQQGKMINTSKRIVFTNTKK